MFRGLEIGFGWLCMAHGGLGWVLVDQGKELGGRKWVFRGLGSIYPFWRGQGCVLGFVDGFGESRAGFGGGTVLGFRGFLHPGYFCCDILCCHGDVGTHSAVRLGWES